MIGFFATTLATAALTIGSPGPFGPSPVNLNASYVDDTVPHACQVIAQQVGAGIPLVIAAVAQAQPDATCHNVSSPAILYALEWYPYVDGTDVAGPPPCGHSAYILQDDFAFPSSPPPTPEQAFALLGQAMSCHPQLVLEY